MPFRVPQDADELGRRVEETDAALVVIDPLMEFIDGKVDSHKSHPVRQALAALNQIAREHGCAVLAIFHLNKGPRTDPLLRHEGSAAFTQVVRGGLMLGHDPDDPDGEDGSQRVLAVSSSNLAAIAPSLVYRIDTARVDGRHRRGDRDRQDGPHRRVGGGAHDLLRGRPTRRSRPDRRGGRVPACGARGRAAARRRESRPRHGSSGISETSLCRARQKLG